jgi:hypothetical protein
VRKGASQSREGGLQRRDLEPEQRKRRSILPAACARAHIHSTCNGKRSCEKSPIRDHWSAGAIEPGTRSRRAIVGTFNQSHRIDDQPPYSNRHDKRESSYRRASWTVFPKVAS